MRCLCCHSKIEPGVSYCSNCGASTKREKQENVKKIELKCENCGGSLVVDINKSILFCPFCGKRTLIIDNDDVAIEKIRASAEKEIAFEQIKSNDRYMQMEEEKNKRNQEKKQVESFRKSFFSRFLIVAVVIGAFFSYLCFSEGNIKAGVFAAVQTVCFATAWSMGVQIIKEKKPYLHILLAIIGVVLIIPAFRSWGTIHQGKIVKEKSGTLLV